MASFGFNWAGAVVELEHSEVQTVVDATDVAAAAADVVDNIPGIPGALAAVLKLYLALQKWLIQQVDVGNGIFLTLPYPAIWFQQWWIIVPTSR